MRCRSLTTAKHALMWVASRGKEMRANVIFPPRSKCHTQTSTGANRTPLHHDRPEKSALRLESGDLRSGIGRSRNGRFRGVDMAQIV